MRFLLAGLILFGIFFGAYALKVYEKLNINIDLYERCDLLYNKTFFNSFINLWNYNICYRIIFVHTYN